MEENAINEKPFEQNQSMNRQMAAAMPQNQEDVSEVKQEVTELKEKIASKELEEKVKSQLTWTLSSFFIGGAGIFTALIIKRTIGESASMAELAVGGVSDMLSTIIKAGWIIGITGIIVGLVLLAMFINTYIKYKKGLKTVRQSKQLQQHPSNQQQKQSPQQGQACHNNKTQ